MTEPQDGVLERRALRIDQNSHTPLYLFALAAEEVGLVADFRCPRRHRAVKAAAA